MTGEADSKEKKEARVIALVVLVVIIAAGVFLLVPSLAEFSAAYLEPGLALRN